MVLTIGSSSEEASLHARTGFRKVSFKEGWYLMRVVLNGMYQSPSRGQNFLWICSVIGIQRSLLKKGGHGKRLVDMEPGRKDFRKVAFKEGWYLMRVVLVYEYDNDYIKTPVNKVQPHKTWSMKMIITVRYNNVYTKTERNRNNFHTISILC